MDTPLITPVTTRRARRPERLRRAAAAAILRSIGDLVPPGRRAEFDAAVDALGRCPDSRQPTRA